MDYRIPSDLRRTIDIAFPKRRIAVFVDGCFWHGCPEHTRLPRTNAAFWRAKLQANALRDADTSQRLACEGWTVLRFWEHEDPKAAAETVADAWVASGVNTAT